MIHVVLIALIPWLGQGWLAGWFVRRRWQADGLGWADSDESAARFLFLFGPFFLLSYIACGNVWGPASNPSGYSLPTTVQGIFR